MGDGTVEAIKSVPPAHDSTMLRITVRTRRTGLTVVFEGRFAGPWVDEVRACWRRLVAAKDPRSIRIDLNGVTFVDMAGMALLWAIHREGAALVASGGMTGAIVQAIKDRRHTCTAA